MTAIIDFLGLVKNGTSEEAAMNHATEGRVTTEELTETITKETELLKHIIEAVERLAPILRSELLSQGSKGPGAPPPGPGGNILHAMQLLLRAVENVASDLARKIGQLSSADVKA